MLSYTKEVNYNVLFDSSFMYLYLLSYLSCKMILVMKVSLTNSLPTFPAWGFMSLHNFKYQINKKINK